jgi:ATP-dependent protease HslVU (ClpYQ) ATPase subunit
MNQKLFYNSQLDNSRDFMSAEYEEAIRTGSTVGRPVEQVIHELAERNIELVQRLDEALVREAVMKAENRSFRGYLDDAIEALQKAEAEADRLRALLRRQAEPTIPARPISRWGLLP